MVLDGMGFGGETECNVRAEHAGHDGAGESSGDGRASEGRMEEQGQATER